MPGRTVRVRDADGREFEAMATDARHHGWEVIDEPQSEPETQNLAIGEGSVEPADAIDKAIDAGWVDWTPPTDEPTQTPAAEAVDKKKPSKSTPAAVIDSESAPTSEGTSR